MALNYARAEQLFWKGQWSRKTARWSRAAKWAEVRARLGVNAGGGLGERSAREVGGRKWSAPLRGSTGFPWWVCLWRNPTVYHPVEIAPCLCCPGKGPRWSHPRPYHYHPNDEPQYPRRYGVLRRRWNTCSLLD